MPESSLKLLYIASKGDPDRHDYLDAALTSAIFGQTVEVLFLGQGVQQLVATPIATLAEYGVEHIYVQREALSLYGMDENRIDPRGLCVNSEQIKQILARQDCVFNL